MIQKKQQVARKETRSSSKNGRIFYGAIAGATLLISGCAVAMVTMGSSLVPARTTVAVSPMAALTQPSTNGENRAPAIAFASASPAELSRAPSGKELANVMIVPAPEEKRAAAANLTAAREAEARSAAKQALVEKFARQRLASSLLAAQAASKAAADTKVASLEAPDTTGSIPQTDPAAATVTAALSQSAAASGAAQDSAVSALETTAVASLETRAPVKPGAIMPPTPDLKPEPPKRAPAAVAAKPDKPTRETAKPTVLAYATPGNPEDDDNGVFSGIGKLFGGGGGRATPGNGVAVYDISAATVHMPDGSKLEAHSGIGHRMDNPKYTHVRNLGPTPPNVYKLRMRERLFHGVEAIRMLPYDRGAMKGRDGMLTHTRLLRSSIGSHGCVAFKDYNKFLTAFKQGKIHTLIVVPSMNKLPSYVAMMERRGNAS